MLIRTLRSLFERDLKRLKFEIDSYKNESRLWSIDGNISNSAGNLCLHLIGNLNAYIGAEIGKKNYTRQRGLEFTQKDISKDELVRRIDETIFVVNDSLSKMTDEELSAVYPILVFEEKTSTEYLLVHLATHLTYHLGQINYHRRLLDEQ